MVWEFYNDVELLPIYLLFAVAYFLVLFASVIFHEVGHWLYFRRIGKKLKINFVYKNIFNMWFETGTPEDYQDLSDEDYLYSLWMGVVCGLLPIIASSFFFGYMILIIVPYGVGCISDLKEINKVYEARGEAFLGLEDE